MLSNSCGDDIYDIMKLTIHHLRSIIRSVIQESLEEKKRDRDDDGDEDFADVMMARMQAGGLSDEEALKKSRKFDDLDEAQEGGKKFAKNVMLPSTGGKFDPKSTMVGVPRPAELSADFSKKPESKQKVIDLSLSSVLSDPRLSDEAREELKKLFKL